MTEQHGISPDMAAALARSQAIRGPMSGTGIFGQRAALRVEQDYWRSDGLELAEVVDIELPLAGGPLRARVYRPEEGAPLATVYCHGGGWCLGDLDTHEAIPRRLAAASGMSVVSLDYSLAPEHPFPCALEEVTSAVKYLRLSGIVGFDPGPLALAGDSAGANLVLSAALTLRGTTAAPCALALFYGAFNDDLTKPSYEFFGDGRYGLTQEAMRTFWQFYAPDVPRSWQAAPLRAELSGLPPTYLVAAGLDCLRDDTRDLQRILGRAGVAHELDEVAGVTHGFLRFAREIAAARFALDRAGQFLARRVPAKPYTGRPDLGRHSNQRFWNSGGSDVTTYVDGRERHSVLDELL